MNTLTDYVNMLSAHFLDQRGKRLLIAITGAPACGKSTLARELAKRLERAKCKSVVVPMDGFHLDNSLLEQRGIQHKKGAPETFDADGFLRLINALRDGKDIFAPRFDRTRDIAIGSAIAIPTDVEIVLLEGNYLMFNEAPWADLAPMWDLSVRLSVPLPELRARLIQRWLSLNHSRAVATRRAEGNDIPNAQRVIENAIPCDFTLDGQPTPAANWSA